MGDEFLKGLLALIGKERGLDTPAERDALQGVMGGTIVGNGLSAFAEKMNWLQNNPNATSEQSMAFDGSIDTKAESDWMSKMNWLSENPEITEEQKKILGINVMRGGGDTIQNLGIGTGGLDTPAERDYLQGAMQGQLGRGTMPTGQPNMGALGMRAEFNRQMSALPPQEVQRVQQILAQLNDEQRKTFMQGVANGNTPLGGYGVQDESFRQ